MKKTKEIISTTLNAVDIFEDPIHFNMAGEKALTSSLGGSLSIAIVVFLAVQGITQAVQMFNHDGPQLLQMDEYQDDPSIIYLNSTSNFVLAVVMNRDNDPMDLRTNSLVSFTSTFSQYFRSTDGSQTKVKANIYWAPCNISNFPSPAFPATTFSTYSLEYGYCPTTIDYGSSGVCPDAIKSLYPDCLTPPLFNVQGDFLSQDFEFISFKLTTCNPSHSNYVYGLQCTSEDINTAFDNSEVQINLYFANTLIDPSNYHTPNKTFLDTIYWNVNPSVAIATDIFVDAQTVQDYDSYVSTNNNQNRTFFSFESNGIRDQRKFSSSSLLEWNIRRSNLNHVTSRTYTKILDVISNIGGLSSLFMLAGAFIALGYTRFKYVMMLGNELYDFQPTEPKKPELDASKSALIALTARMGDVSLETSETSRSRSFFRKAYSISRKKVHVEDNQTVKNYFEDLKKRKRSLNYNEISYITYLIKTLFGMKKNPDEIMAKKAMKQVREDLDIIKVIEKMKEVDKLKMLLLNSDQRKAFDFIEKPLFTVTKERPVQAGSLNRLDEHKSKSVNLESRAPIYSADYDSLSDYAKLYMTYRSLKEDPDIDNIKYNQKLLEMISDDLRTVFRRVDEIMGSEADPKRFEQIVKQIMNQKDTTLTDDRLGSLEEKRETSPDPV